jgi:hypothetical protein
MPVRWAVVLAIVSGLALGGWGYIAGELVASRLRPDDSARYFVDACLVPVHTGARVWSVRWLEYGQTRMIQVEEDEVNDRLVAHLGGIR